MLPQDIAKRLPKNRLLSEAEWRGLGVCQSRGWVHYAIHRCAGGVDEGEAGALGSPADLAFAA